MTEDLQELVCSCGEEPESARVAMRLLKEKYDYETTTSTLQLFKNFIQTKMEEGESVSDYISRFETLFSHVFSRCSESSRPEAIALKNFLTVEEVKVMCFFLSLPSSMDNIIDNLTTKDNLKYADVQKRLLDLNLNKSVPDTFSNKAYLAGPNEPPHTKERTLECTFCKKNGHNYKGHIHNKCRKLQTHLDQKHKNKQKKPEKYYNRAHAVTDNPDIVVSDVGKNKAFLSSSSSSPSHWILDSGCSAHMTSQKKLLTQFTPVKGVVTLADVPVKHRQL